jgi:hypothetical protein
MRFASGVGFLSSKQEREMRLAMKVVFQRVQAVALLALGSLLISCGGGGSDPSTTQATTYYVDSISGNDFNTGLDISSPWQTLAKVNSAPVASGSTVYLKRGSVWYEQLTIPNSSITIDAYGSGARPKIDGSREVGVGAWTNEGVGLYSAVVSLSSGVEGLGNLSQNGVMMPFVAWNTDAATTFFGAANGTYSYSYPDRLYIKSATAPSGAYRASVKFYGITSVSLSDIIVNNVETTRFSLHGINFIGCVRCEAHDVVVSRGGGAVISPSPLLYAGNGIEFDNNSTNGVVDGAAVSDIFDSCISPQTYASSQTMSSITIKNSTVDKCGFAGVEVSVLSNGGTTGSSIVGVTLSGLTVTNSGKGWSGRRYGTEGNGIRIIADAGAGSMSNVQVDTTTIDGSVGDGIRLAGNIGTINLHRMNIRNNVDGISLLDPVGAATSDKLHLTSSLVHHNTRYGISYYSPTAAGFELYQNTFSENAGSNIAVFSQNGIAKLRNNIFYGSTAHLYAAAAFAGDVVMDNNCYNNFANMISYNGAPAYSTATAFQIATGFETNGIGGTVGLNNPAAGNFALTFSSQCKTLGSSAVGVTTDFSGYLFASPPSSGAYQYR